MTELEIWLRYFLIWPGLQPIGNPAEADVIIIQAFGRNSIPDSELYSIGQLRELSNNDWLTINKLGQGPINFDPGEPNVSLALECQDLVDQYHLPVITQWEVAAAFGPRWHKRHRESIFCVWPPTEPQIRFSTREVISLTAEVMAKHGWEKPIILAHKRHIARVYLIAKKLLAMLPTVVAQKTKGFDSQSVQIWTRNWFFWFMYEILGRGYHLLKKWV